ncbi:hypothetical protein CYMTET_31991 [Cymbomonas tetramitiformis]|uniref:Uncharacterized protein n=1 Tax=Cymbomonas tetramitiformis TaxID=36881 RepID=A0AAE0KSN9_9CHLO|nr:hypothetical protein CYMTET_31991 [Cymbomonas tetramitiformis]
MIGIHPAYWRRHWWLVSRQCGGLARPAHAATARVLPYKDVFLMLWSSEAEALQLVKHLGLEVDITDEQFKVSPQRIEEIWAVSSLSAWGGVLNLRVSVRGFWSRELGCHITHLELEAVTSTVQTFLQELKGRAVLLRCDNQAVVHMLAHFTSRDPALMWRIRRLWILLNLHNIELTAKYICNEANEWANQLSRIGRWMTGG